MLKKHLRIDALSSMILSRIVGIEEAKRHALHSSLIYEMLRCGQFSPSFRVIAMNARLSVKSGDRSSRRNQIPPR